MSTAYPRKLGKPKGAKKGVRRAYRVLTVRLTPADYDALDSARRDLRESWAGFLTIGIPRKSNEK